MILQMAVLLMSPLNAFCVEISHLVSATLKSPTTMQCCVHHYGNDLKEFPVFMITAQMLNKIYCLSLKNLQIIILDCLFGLVLLTIDFLLKQMATPNDLSVPRGVKIGPLILLFTYHSVNSQVIFGWVQTQKNMVQVKAQNKHVQGK